MTGVQTCALPILVIFVDNLLKEKQHWSSLIGIAGGTIVYMLLVQMM